MNSFKIPVHFQKKRPLNFEYLPKISGLTIYNPNKNLIRNPTTIDTPIAKNPGIIKLVARVRPVSSRLTANNNVGCAGITKLTLSVWTIAMKYIGGIPILMTIGTIMEAVAVCEITIIATMATKTMTNQGID